MKLPAPPITLPSIPPKQFPSRTVFERQLIETFPKLRAFAWKLTKNAADSDDLVQETAVRALHAYQRFQIGTSMQAWTFTILRNHWINGLRKQPGCNEELTEAIILRNPTKGNQDDSIELNETFDAMERLKSTHRDVLTFVRILGDDYEQTAKVMGCAVGTIKSRLNRADAALRVITDH